MYFPQNAREWQAWSDLHTQTKGAITNTQSIQPQMGGTREQKSGMIPPNRSSVNWNTALWKGYHNSSQASTYIIPKHEQLQLALFSRYILKDPNATGTPLLERAQKRFQESRSSSNQEFQSIKHYQNMKRTPFNHGGVSMAPKVAVGGGVPLEEVKVTDVTDINLADFMETNI